MFFKIKGLSSTSLALYCNSSSNRFSLPVESNCYQILHYFNRPMNHRNIIIKIAKIARRFNHDAIANSSTSCRNVVNTDVQPPDIVLLSCLVCPLSKGPLVYDANKNVLISETINVNYLIRKDGLINMMPHDAKLEM